MRRRTFADNRELARLLAAKAGATALAWALSPWHWLRWQMERVPERLLIAPQDIRTADPTLAEEIYSGYFAFGGKMVNAHGISPFDLDPPSQNWSRALVGFGWLRHLRAANTALARANARALVDDFIAHAHAGEGSPATHEPAVLARRILSWLSQSPIILEGADRLFYRRFMVSLTRDQARLQALFASGLPGEARLQAAIALAAYALCADVAPRVQRRATRQLVGELSRQILADGGHIGRNPRAVVDLLLDLLPLRQAFVARVLPVPAQLLNSIDRMMPMLRLFRHNDAGLALFNGMGVGSPGSLATILAYDDAHSAAITNARPSGYQRIEAAGALLIMDTGAPPPPEFSLEAHAGCLAVEFSSNGQRLIVNCGAPGLLHPEALGAARTTAAHSTLVVADTSSCRFAASSGFERFVSGQIISGPRNVSVARISEASRVTIEAGHDGYERGFGLMHSRRISLSADGWMLKGEDHLSRIAAADAPSSLAFHIRFHLHPAVRLEAGGTGTTVDLHLGNGEVWRFAGEGLQIHVEESIFFAAANGPRPSQQLVIKGHIKDQATESWSFARIGA